MPRPIEIAPVIDQEKDGTYTFSVEITGIPDLDSARKISDWMGKIIKENAHKVGALQDLGGR